MGQVGVHLTTANISQAIDCIESGHKVEVITDQIGKMMEK